MKTFLKNFSTIIVLSFKILLKLIDSITIKRIVESLKLDKFYMFIRDASLLDLLYICLVLTGIYLGWKLLYMMIYVFQ